MLTTANEKNSGMQNLRVVFMDVTFDASYPAGGEALTPNDFGMESIDTMHVTNGSGCVCEYDAANEKLKAFWVDTTVDGALMAEVVAATDLSAVTVRCMAIGY